MRDERKLIEDIKSKYILLLYCNILYYNYPVLWNTIVSEDIKQHENKKDFTIALKENMLAQLNFQCERLFCYVCKN